MTPANRRVNLRQKGGRHIWPAHRGVCTMNGRLRLFYLDGFSFPCEVESKVPDESESDEVADFKRKEKF